MLGAIIGDIVGSRWEFNPTNDYNFEFFSDKNGYTDDTICTVAVADALLHGSDDYGKYIHKWCRKYPHPMGGYGGRFAKWVMNDNPKPYGSYGNGSAMRCSPIGWWFEQPDTYGGVFSSFRRQQLRHVSHGWKQQLQLPAKPVCHRPSALAGWSQPQLHLPRNVHLQQRSE